MFSSLYIESFGAMSFGGGRVVVFVDSHILYPLNPLVKKTNPEITKRERDVGIS